MLQINSVNGGSVMKIVLVKPPKFLKKILTLLLKSKK